ncbi:MAG: hypothetical protein ACE5FT_04925 [Candidatus Nanoarchaeia archaeon]
MKETFDTNVFVYSTVSQTCATAFESTYIKSKDNIVVATIHNETRQQLRRLNERLRILQSELKPPKNPLKLLQSKLHKEYLGREFPQIYRALTRYIENNKISKENTQELSEVIDQIFYLMRCVDQAIRQCKYPVTERDLKQIQETEPYKKILIQLQNIITNDSDCTHLALCNQYITENLKGDKLKFVTLDKQDFISGGKKEKIETIIQGLIITTVEGVNLEDIQIND